MSPRPVVPLSLVPPTPIEPPEEDPCPIATSSSGSCSGARPPAGRTCSTRPSGSTGWATTTSGPGTTCTRSSATRTSRSSRAGRSLAAWAMVTERTRLGLLVGANTFRNPGSSPSSPTTLDHVSDGRAILGIGGAWMELEHQAHGIDFGSGFGQRLDWLDESVGAIRARPRRRVGHVAARRPLRASTTCATCRRRSRSTCRS